MITPVSYPAQTLPGGAVSATAPDRAPAAAASPDGAESPGLPNDAAFFSPRLRLSVEANQAVLEFRDPETGEVTRQVPSEAELAAYRREQDTRPAEQPPVIERARENAPAPAPDREAGETPAPVAKPAIRSVDTET